MAQDIFQAPFLGSSGHRPAMGDAEVARLRSELAACKAECEELRLYADELVRLLVAKGERPPEKGKTKARANAEDNDATGTTLEDTDRLWEHLHHGVYVRLAASPIAGVGVFAVREIPSGVEPFTICNRHLSREERFCVLPEDRLRRLDPDVFALLESFFAPITDDDNWTPQRDDRGEVLYGVNATGLHTLDSSWYLNHSDNPNVAFKDAENDGEYNSYVTKRTVAKGEELLVDYRELGELYYALVSGGRER
mmetsp:Transcript_14017/g.38302  ORF Transcript_14017/g.38302 Transcript_14017/m.38302 type:complete len:252 (+) Transcript_14017:1-756(+)